MKNKALERIKAGLVVSVAVAGSKSLMLQKDRKGFFFTTGSK